MSRNQIRFTLAILGCFFTLSASASSLKNTRVRPTLDEQIDTMQSKSCEGLMQLGVSGMMVLSEQNQTDFAKVCTDEISAEDAFMNAVHRLKVSVDHLKDGSSGQAFKSLVATSNALGNLEFWLNQK